jgi:hypothetical protein
MYVIDLTHYLDPKGAIAPERGPARKFADFVTAVVAHATDFDRPDDTAGPAVLQVPQARPARRSTLASPRMISVVWRLPGLRHRRAGLELAGVSSGI